MCDEKWILNLVPGALLEGGKDCVLPLKHREVMLKSDESGPGVRRHVLSRDQKIAARQVRKAPPPSPAQGHWSQFNLHFQCLSSFARSVMCHTWGAVPGEARRCPLTNK